MSFKSGLALAVVIFSAPLLAQAQDMPAGQREYMSSCAQCHGASGKGDGFLAGYLNTPVPDLTTLKKNNGGVFPVASLYGIIDGSDVSGIHGTSDMPAWGMRYGRQAGRMLGREFSPRDEEFFIRGRILSLIEYIDTLQVE
ncbi:MAG: c-type cytochrome [Paracoccaceae bacterium]